MFKINWNLNPTKSIVFNSRIENKLLCNYWFNKYIIFFNYFNRKRGFSILFLINVYISSFLSGNKWNWIIEKSIIKALTDICATPGFLLHAFEYKKLTFFEPTSKTLAIMLIEKGHVFVTAYFYWNSKSVIQFSTL